MTMEPSLTEIDRLRQDAQWALVNSSPYISTKLEISPEVVLWLIDRTEEVRDELRAAERDFGDQQARYEAELQEAQDRISFLEGLVEDLRDELEDIRDVTPPLCGGGAL